MSVSLLLAATVSATTATPQWQVDLVWGCQVTEKGRADYLIQGRLMSSDDGKGGRRHVMQVLKDERGRLEGYVARWPYYVNPRPGEHWVLGVAPSDANLILKFAPPSKRGWVEIGSGAAQEPVARGVCEFEDKA